jgi:transcriptional regulator with XRE-family HTH domain
MSCTVKDVAQLAGVSVATVSRVMNGSERVSFDAKASVLSAIARLHYCPDIHAVELGLGKGKNQYKRGCHMFASKFAKPQLYADRKAKSLLEWRNTHRLRALEEENARLKQLVTKLSLDVEMWQKIAQ